jgi:hypothetical protein
MSSGAVVYQLAMSPTELALTRGGTLRDDAHPHGQLEQLKKLVTAVPQPHGKVPRICGCGRPADVDIMQCLHTYCVSGRSARETVAEHQLIGARRAGEVGTEGRVRRGHRIGLLAHDQRRHGPISDPGLGTVGPAESIPRESPAPARSAGQNGTREPHGREGDGVGDPVAPVRPWMTLSPWPSAAPRSPQGRGRADAFRSGIKGRLGAAQIPSNWWQNCHAKSSKRGRFWPGTQNPPPAGKLPKLPNPKPEITKA